MHLTVLMVATAMAAAPPAQVFAPGTISAELNDFAPAFSKDMSWLMFSRGDSKGTSLYIAHRTDRTWSTPELAPFSGKWVDMESSLAPDGSYVVFASDRPAQDDGTALRTTYFGKPQVGGNLWRVDRNGEGWSAPYRLSTAINPGTSVWTPSIARTGNIYFMATDPASGRFRIHSAAQDANARTRDLAFSTGATNDVDPYIAPDESYAVFSSDRGTPGKDGQPGRERLYIAFHPTSADPVVCRIDVPGFSDETLSEIEARVGPDQKDLYFASSRPEHETGAPPKGVWDNGKSNIWVVPFTSALWANGKQQPARCSAQTLQQR